MSDLIKNPELVVNAEIKKNFEYVKITDREGKILRLILADEIFLDRETEFAGSQINAQEGGPATVFKEIQP